MTKLERINMFLEKYKNLPAQRSKEWHANRIGRFGASELHNIINLKNTNVNTFVNNFLYNKIIPRENYFIFPCVFGNIFENEIKNLTEYNYKTKIYEAGSIPYEKLKCVSCSPDGFGIVNDEIVLFEFKCPISREIKRVIKFEYFVQVSSGLHVLEEVVDNKALYIEAEFKKCLFEDLVNKPNFDQLFHNKNIIGRNFSELYKHFGMILFYEITDDIIAKSPDDFEIIDLGAAVYIEMETLFFNIHKKKFGYLHLSDIINNSDDMCPIIRDKFINMDSLFSISELEYLKNLLINEYIKKNVIHAKTLYILPWKCYNYNIIKVEKDVEFFTEEIKERCVYFSYIVKYLKKLNDNDDLSEEEIKKLLYDYTKKFLN